LRERERDFKQKKTTKHSFPFFYFHKNNLRLGISIFEQLFFLSVLWNTSLSQTVSNHIIEL
jgi:hypothetical protein